MAELPSSAEQIRDDERARECAVDPTRSWVVRAPAGSGKTELLIQRYLALLAHCEHPEQVLAITFTVKAAGEMRARILAALESARTAPSPSATHARLTWELAQAVVRRDGQRDWQLLQTPARLRIQTIDALCMYIASRNPLSARLVGIDAISAQPDVLYRESANAVFDRWSARSGELTSSPEQVVLSHLHGDQERAVHLLAQMLSMRDSWLRHVVLGAVGDVDAHAWRAHLEASLRHIVAGALEPLERLLPKDLETELVALAAHAGEMLAAVDGESPILRCRELRTLPRAHDPDASSVWRAIRQLLLTRQGERRTQVTARIGFGAPQGKDAVAAQWRRRMREFLEALGAHPQFLRVLAEVEHLPEPAYSEDQWALVEALTALLPQAVAHLKLLFAERGEVDFTEVSHAALRALESSVVSPDANTALASDTALALDEQVHHILVDEFQDTSHPQLALLRGLTAGWIDSEALRTLFVVGDPMQSIYRFRDAQVRLFLEVQSKGLGPLRLPTLQLRRNFRSDALLVRWVNEVMAAVQEEQSPGDAMEEGQVVFEASVPVREASTATKDTISLSLQVGSDRAYEAQQVVAHVRRALGPHHTRTVAILVRARDHLSCILPALRQAGLRYTGVDIEPLRDTLEVRDVHALTRALWHLGDRAAWLAVLRAPWCGLTLADLHALVREDRGRTIWDCVIDQQGRARLSEDGRRRLSRVKGVLADAWRQRGKTSLRDSVEGAWTAMGGAATLRGEQELANVARYFDLLDAIDQGGRLTDLAPLEEGLDALFAQPDPRADGSLQIMTMHKSKGLEFDVVIVSGLGAAPRPAPRALMEVAEIVGNADGAAAGPHLVVGPIGNRRAPDPIGDYLRRRDRQLDRHETLRLAYVTLTRAREELHLLGEVRPGQHDDREPRPASGSLLGLMQPGLQATGLWTGALANARQSDPETAHGKVRGSGVALTRLPSDWSLKRMPVPEVVRVPRPSLAEESPLLMRSGAGELSRQVGRVTHWVLTRMAANGELRAPSRSQASINRRVVGALHRAGLREDPLLDAARRTLGAVQSTLADPKGRWALGAQAAHVDVGWSLSGWLDERQVSARVDLSFVVEGTRWLIELRTSAHEGGGLDAFINDEMRVVSRELSLALRLGALLDDQLPLRAGAYFPQLGEWREVTAIAPPA